MYEKGEKLFAGEVYQYKLSDLKGLKYLPWVSCLELRDYTGTTLDLSKYPHITTVHMSEFWKNKFRLVAPHAKEIWINSETGGSWSQAKLSEIDVSKCKNVVYLTLAGSYFRDIAAKLPASGVSLRWLSIYGDRADRIDLNKYKNLELAYFYNNKYRTCKMKRCTKLRYVYFYCMNQLSSVDVRTAKVTKNTGRWWENSSAWTKLVDQIYKSM